MHYNCQNPIEIWMGNQKWDFEDLLLCVAAEYRPGIHMKNTTFCGESDGIYFMIILQLFASIPIEIVTFHSEFQLWHYFGFLEHHVWVMDSIYLHVEGTIFHGESSGIYFWIVLLQFTSKTIKIAVFHQYFFSVSVSWKTSPIPNSWGTCTHSITSICGELLVKITLHSIYWLYCVHDIILNKASVTALYSVIIDDSKHCTLLIQSQ